MSQRSEAAAHSLLPSTGLQSELASVPSNQGTEEAAPQPCTLADTWRQINNTAQVSSGRFYQQLVQILYHLHLLNQRILSLPPLKFSTCKDARAARDAFCSHHFYH